jgi:protein-S-isoprenylcysteine O-methyltransferase Ste14
MLLRAIAAFVALPGLIAFVVPLVLARRAIGERAFSPAGLVPLLGGTAVLLWAVWEFYRVGKGTLVPWQPPRYIVITGPYRYSRNPMYVAVGLILIGWALLFASIGLLVYAVVVVTAFHLRVVLGEEPWLDRRHGPAWRDYATQAPRWIFPNRRVLLITWLTAAAGLPLAGLLAEGIADGRARREFPPPGRLVDVGGRSLHLLCLGTGSPTVLFEASGWGNALSAQAVRERLAQQTTVCSYDRRGAGWSDGASGVTTAGGLADDLGVLQDRAGLAWPLVIVASSIGGATAEMFARRYPERVSGIVMVDAANSLTAPMLAARSGTATLALCAAGALARFGVLRLLDPFAIGVASDEARRSAALT